MKRYRFLRFSLMIIGLVVLVRCMTIVDIVYPDEPLVNSEVEIKVNIKLEPENSNNTKLIFAVLAPKSWNLKENGVLNLTSNGYSEGDVENELMSLVAVDAIEPTTGQEWSKTIQSVVGLMDNYGPVEWIVYESKTVFKIDDSIDKLITGVVNIKLNTGTQNMKVNLGYFFCGKDKGLHEDFYTENAKSKVITISGGNNVLLDYTTPNLVSTIPSVMSYKDIFAIQFESAVGNIETELLDEENVYLLGKVVYENNGIIDSILIQSSDEFRKMKRISNLRYRKYIYIQDYFGLNSSDEVEEVSFYFSDQSQNKVVTLETGDFFTISESCD